MRGDFPAAAAYLRPHQSPAVTASPDRGKPFALLQPLYEKRLPSFKAKTLRDESL